MLGILILLAVAVFASRYAFKALGAQRVGGILRRAFWCCYVLWAGLVLYSYSFTTSRTEWGWTAGLFLLGPLVLYRLVIFIATGRWGG